LGSNQNSPLGFNSTSGIGSNFDSMNGGGWSGGHAELLETFAA
jgi:hypothetical protein